MRGNIQRTCDRSIAIKPGQVTISSFLSPLIYENQDGRKLRIVEPFEYLTGDGKSICVPAGFICDGQSYPRMFWFIDTPQGKGAKAGVVHDYLYHMNGRPLPDGKTYDRKEADKIFLEALEVSGVNAFSRATRYRMLRMFGKPAWNAHAKRIAATLPGASQ